MTDIFVDDQSATTPDDDQLTLDHYVGEGKKYSDNDAVAKALYHKDKHIESVEGTLAELRAELAGKSSLEEALKNLQNSGKTPTESTPPSGEPIVSEEVAKGLTQEEARDIFLRMKEEDQATSNLAEVQAKVKAFTGSDEAASKYIREKAAELQMTPAELRELSQKRPSAALKLMEVGSTPKDQSSGIKTYNPKSLGTAPNPSNPQTVADFDELRKKDLNAFFSPKVQQAYMAAKLAEKNKTN